MAPVLDMEGVALPSLGALVPNALPPDVEQRLATLAGVEPPGPVADRPVTPVESAGHPEFARRLLRVAQVVTLGALVLISTAAVLAARFGSRGLPVHEVPLAVWGLVAALAAVALAALAQEGTATVLSVQHRRAIGPPLMLLLLASVTGVVASADGVAGPAWVLFLPVVLVAGAVLGRVLGLATGATAAFGVYAAAAVSHTLTIAGVGRLVVLLPAFPAVGWAAGALAGLARDAAERARLRGVELERDVRKLSALLAEVADGDLTSVPAPGEHADPVTTGLAVAFADTLLALRRLVRQMGSVADQLVANANDLAGTAEHHVLAVDQQNAAVVETTSTVEELAATAGAIAEIAVRVSQFAGSTRGDVDAGAAAVQEATAAMQRIAERTADLTRRAEVLRERIVRIGDTTQVIDELARQTSILAVNASIEAARAGDHGRGFTNVAEEVGTLAARAREATAQIARIVNELGEEAEATAAASREGSQAVAGGVSLHQEVVAALARISAMVDRTTMASHEITEATRQQRAASDAVVEAMTTVTVASDRYGAGSRRHAEAANRLRDLAGELRAALRRFRVS